MQSIRNVHASPAFNEPTPESTAALTDDIGIPLSALCKELMVLMTGAIENGEVTVPGQFFLPFDIHLPENIWE